MAKMEKIRNMQIVDNKEDKFFCFPMISVACTGSGYKIEEGDPKVNKDRTGYPFSLSFGISIRQKN